MTGLFRIPPERARRIRFRDLLIIAVATLIFFPAVMFAIGSVGGLAVRDDAGWITVPIILIRAFGLTGLFAWAAAPIALGLGWLATRSGWIGPLAAPVVGMAGGVLFSLIFVLDQDITDIGWEHVELAASLGALAAIYGGFAWVALRLLRRDVFETPTPH